MSFYESTLYNALPVILELSCGFQSKRMEIYLSINEDVRLEPIPAYREGFSISIMTEDKSYQCKLDSLGNGNRFNLAHLPVHLQPGTYRLLAGVPDSYSIDGVTLIETFIFGSEKENFVHLGADEHLCVNKTHKKIHLVVECHTNDYLGTTRGAANVA